MEQKIYVGPTIQSMGLLRNQVFIDGLPGHIKAAIAQIPEVEDLIVELDELTDAMKNVQTKGEGLYRKAQIVLQKAGKA